MKKLFLSIVCVISLSALSSFTEIGESKSKTIKGNKSQYGSDFCEGWEDGYCEGYKYVKGGYAICPITPICPIPRIGEDSYRGGYNRGFLAGMRAAQR